MTSKSQPDNLLSVVDLAAGYEDSNVFHGINFTVKSGEIRVILGPSGGGKTTLLKVLIGNLLPRQGHVYLLGEDLFTAAEKARARLYTRIGMLFQSGALLNALSVADNVALPLREHAKLTDAEINDIVWMKLALVGLEKAAHRMPRELSGGMRKRAALARAMALDPELLFCDEPSAGLDPNTAADLDQLIVNLRDQFGMGIVVVTHELASIHAIADKVLMLHRGQMHIEGTLANVASSNDPIVRSFFAREGQGTTLAHPCVLDVLYQEKD